MIPAKLQIGSLFKPSVISKINEIIDYLKTQRIIGDNKTIRVSQYASGVGITSITNPVKSGNDGGGRR